MQLFVKTVNPTPGMKILDLGGEPAIWDFVETPLNITCLNLPGIVEVDHPTHHTIEYREGNACDMPNLHSGDFDMVFSNSVLEHVGDPEMQNKFTSEVKRLSDTYWIQTPCKAFPIEAHSGMLFWWYYPSWLRTYFLNRWSTKLPAWTEMVAGTTVITKKSLQEMLPSARIITEWLIFPKSLIAYAHAQGDTHRSGEYATSEGRYQGK